MAKPHKSAIYAPLSLPKELIIEGAIEYPGAITIAGTIEGDVVGKEVTIAERAVINGSIRAESVKVMGEVNGEIYANVLTLKAASVVTGDIFHNQLILEDGCIFEGKSRRMIIPIDVLA